MSLRLAINGGSNGGLLVMACALQAPELFGAVVADVGYAEMACLRMYMYRFMAHVVSIGSLTCFDFINLPLDMPGSRTMATLKKNKISSTCLRTYLLYHMSFDHVFVVCFSLDPCLVLPQVFAASHGEQGKDLSHYFIDNERS